MENTKRLKQRKMEGELTFTDARRREGLELSEQESEQNTDV
jgi:hypothetical protein